MEKWLSHMEKKMDGMHKCMQVCIEDGHDMKCQRCRLWHDDTGCEAFGLDYTEIRKLHDMLTVYEIPHTFEVRHGGYHLCYPTNGFRRGERVCSAILHGHSYGSQEGLIEIMGLLKPDEGDDGDVCGWLTAEDVFSRIEKHWKEKNG